MVAIFFPESGVEECYQMFDRKKKICGFDYIDVLFIAGKRARAKTSTRAPCLCGHSLHAGLELVRKGKYNDKKQDEK